jgi:hypothetical protein
MDRIGSFGEIWLFPFRACSSRNRGWWMGAGSAMESFNGRGRTSAKTQYPKATALLVPYGDGDDHGSVYFGLRANG